MRIDKWLWYVRICKTRSIAAGECKKGRVEIDSVTVKPSRLIKINEVIYIKKPPVQFVYKVVDLPKNRVSPKMTEQYIMDMTPDYERDKLKILKESYKNNTRKGMGRPTKKDRRDIGKFNSNI